MNFFQNITVRRPRSQSGTENIEIQTTHDSLEDTCSSLPHISVDDNSQNMNKLREQKSEIDGLMLKLSIANQEVDRLNLENVALRKEIDDLHRKNRLFKKITDNLTQSSSTPIKKRNNLSSTLLRFPKSSTQTRSSRATDTAERAEELRTHSSHIAVETKKTYRSEEYDLYTKTSKHRGKLLILSSNQQTRTLQMAIDTFSEDFNICRYSKPGACIKELFKNMERKIINFTKNDCCVIMIGEADFKKTSNNYDLITFIRDTLLPLRHTNFVVCLPTYKIGQYVSVYNWRVEHFNNMLCLDTGTHKHAYTLDTNLNLTYDCAMFSEYNGILKNSGMRVIFDDLSNIIYEIVNYDNVIESENVSCIHESFMEGGNGNKFDGDKNFLFRE